MSSKREPIVIRPPEGTEIPQDGAETSDLVPSSLQPTKKKEVPAIVEPGTNGNSGKSSNQGNQGGGWADVGGYQKQLTQLREVIELTVLRPGLLKSFGINPANGLLLIGGPGTGKTHIGKAIFNETGAPVFWLNGHELLTAPDPCRNLSDGFSRIQKSPPGIIFIENIELVAPNRANITCEKQKSLLFHLLELIDGFQASADILVVGTSSSPEQIDPALRRFGRLGIEIPLGNPGKRDRFQILNVHTRGMELAKDVSLEYIASNTEGFVGSDLAALCFMAALQQIRKKMPQMSASEQNISPRLTMKDFHHALFAMKVRKANDPAISLAQKKGKESDEDSEGLARMTSRASARGVGAEP